MKRRDLLRAGAAIFGGAVGSRILGPLGEAQAAPETSHLVFVYFHGGFNGVFGGAGNMFANKAFDTTSGNLKQVGNGVATDAATFGTLPQFALDHWAAVGFKHGDALHTLNSHPNGGAEHTITRKGNGSYITSLASIMGGSSPLKAVHTGPYPPFRVQPATSGVSLQHMLDFDDVLKAVGAQAPAATGPARASSAATLAAANDLSRNKFAANPESLRSLSEGYGAGVASLQQPPPAPVSREEVMTAYGLKSTAVQGFAAQLAAAEVSIRAAGSNVVTVFDGDVGEWDFSADVSTERSRTKFLGGKIAPLRTFCSRMLNVVGRNVVVVCLGDFVRLTTGHGHGDGPVVAMFGKYLKQGLYNPCDSLARFAAGTPGTDAFWAGVAAALKVPGQPFGANPYAIV